MNWPTRKALLVAVTGLTFAAGSASAQQRKAFTHLKSVENAPQQIADHPYTRQELPTLGENSTLNDYLTYAALNNAELEAAFNRWTAEQERVKQVRTLPDPRFSYGYFIQSVETRVGPQGERLSLSQMFPWFGKLRLRGEAALQIADAAQQQYEHAKLMLFYRVKEAYYEFYYLGRAIAVTTDNRDLVQQFETVAKAKYESDTALYADVIKAQTELDKLNDRLRMLQDFKEPIVAHLNAAMNRPFNAPLIWPKAAPIVHLHLDDQQLVAELTKDNPELKTLDFLSAKEKTGIALAKKEFLPDVRLGVDYTVTGDALIPGTPDSGKDAVMVGFSINLPIWGGKYKAAVREAEARYGAAPGGVATTMRMCVVSNSGTRDPGVQRFRACGEHNRNRDGRGTLGGLPAEAPRVLRAGGTAIGLFAPDRHRAAATPRAPGAAIPGPICCAVS